MSDLNRMTGTPWHINKFERKDGDERRHKSRCIYYIKTTSKCRYQHTACQGSAYCKYYHEEETQARNNDYNRPIEKEKSQKHTNAEFPLGCKVSHKKYGLGVVIGNTNNKLSIKFDSDNEKRVFSLDACIENSFLKRIK